MLEINDKKVKVSLGSIKQKITKETIGKIVKEIAVKEVDDHILLLIDAESVAGVEHLKACIHYAIQAFEQKTNLAKKLSAEILLYLSGYRQISKAIEIVGIKIITTKILFVQIASTTVLLDEFDVIDFLKQYMIQIEELKNDINTFPIFNVSKITANLGITELEISTLLDSTTNYEEVVANLAVEKSALVNLLK